MSKDPVFFWQAERNGAVGPGCLSQWAHVDFVVDGARYRCAEQYMMAEKARLFHDDATLDKIMDAESPMIMKRLGRAVKGRAGGKWDAQDAAAWDAARFDAVVRGNFAKFSQNDALKEYLLSTGDAVLAEASPRDRIWGIGIDAKTAEGTPQANWPGQNLLGKALMKVREMLKAGEGDAALSVSGCLVADNDGDQIGAFGNAHSNGTRIRTERAHRSSAACLSRA